MLNTLHPNLKPRVPKQTSTTFSTINIGKYLPSGYTASSASLGFQKETFQFFIIIFAETLKTKK